MKTLLFILAIFGVGIFIEWFKDWIIVICCIIKELYEG